MNGFPWRYACVHISQFGGSRTRLLSGYVRSTGIRAPNDAPIGTLQARMEIYSERGTAATRAPNDLWRACSGMDLAGRSNAAPLKGA